MIEALLLLGPTGAGKSPLGDYLQDHGLGRRRCFHFDFGLNLRQAATAPHPSQHLSPAELHVIRHALATGALLEDHQFPIALKLIQSFLERNSMGPNDLLILNGIPRHAGQARDLEPLVDVRRVVFLDCPPAAVRDRIRGNAGGDRAGRCDDSEAEVARKIELFRARTAPLLDYYGAKGVTICRFNVTAATTSHEIATRITD